MLPVEQFYQVMASTLLIGAAYYGLGVVRALVWLSVEAAQKAAPYF